LSPGRKIIEIFRLRKKQLNRGRNRKQSEVCLLKVKEVNHRPRPRARKNQRQEEEPNKEDVNYTYASKLTNSLSFYGTTKKSPLQMQSFICLSKPIDQSGN
jgi:hypothetical protein